MLRYTVASMSLALLAFCSAGCTDTREVPVEVTVVVTATPGGQYTAEEVAQLSEQWAARYTSSTDDGPSSGDTRLWVAVFYFCLDNIPQAVRVEGAVPTPREFVAEPREHGRWLVSTHCEADITGGGSQREDFSWLFIEDGPQLLPIGGFAGEVILLR